MQRRHGRAGLGRKRERKKDTNAFVEGERTDAPAWFGGVINLVRQCLPNPGNCFSVPSTVPFPLRHSRAKGTMAFTRSFSHKTPPHLHSIEFSCDLSCDGAGTRPPSDAPESLPLRVWLQSSAEKTAN